MQMHPKYIDFYTSEQGTKGKMDGLSGVKARFAFPSVSPYIWALFLIGEQVSMARKILIVDDEELLRSLLRTELEHLGFETHDVPGGPEALSYLADHEVDIVLLDIKMPEMGGLDVLQRIREDDLARKVIMLTGVGELKIARESLEMGASDFMSKPFEMSSLIACINRVLME